MSTSSFSSYLEEPIAKWNVWSSMDREWFDRIETHFDRYEKSSVGKGQIPKIIHQIWLGGELPSRYDAWISTWKELHPSWEYKLWTDDDLPSLNLKNREALKASENYGEMSDILRYEILYQYGGLYVDIDFECLKNFDPLLKGLNFFAGLSNTGVFEINNALIAACPGHSILAEAVEMISKRLKRPKGNFLQLAPTLFPFLSNKEQDMISTSIRECKAAETLAMSGPGLFTQACMKTELANDALILPHRYFYPVSNTGRQPLHFNDSFAIHHWAKSWIS